MRDVTEGKTVSYQFIFNSSRERICCPWTTFTSTYDVYLSSKFFRITECDFILTEDDGINIFAFYNNLYFISIIHLHLVYTCPRSQIYLGIKWDLNNFRGHLSMYCLVLSKVNRLYPVIELPTIRIKTTGISNGEGQVCPLKLFTSHNF